MKYVAQETVTIKAGTTGNKKYVANWESEVIKVFAQDSFGNTKSREARITDNLSIFQIPTSGYSLVSWTDQNGKIWKPAANINGSGLKENLYLTANYVKQSSTLKNIDNSISDINFSNAKLYASIIGSDNYKYCQTVKISFFPSNGTSEQKDGDVKNGKAGYVIWLSDDGVTKGELLGTFAYTGEACSYPKDGIVRPTLAKPTTKEHYEELPTFAARKAYIEKNYKYIIVEKCPMIKTNNPDDVNNYNHYFVADNNNLGLYLFGNPKYTKTYQLTYKYN